MPRTEDSPRVGGTEHASDEDMQPVPLRLSGFPELGEVTINAPAYYGDSMYPADGNDPARLQMALLTIFRASTPSAAGRTLHGDETTLDALVPAENRWWVPPEVALTQGTAADDGRRELDIVCQILADEGILVEDAEGDSRLNRGAAADNWEDATLSVIEKHLRGGLSPDNPLSAPYRDSTDWCMALGHRRA